MTALILIALALTIPAAVFALAWLRMGREALRVGEPRGGAVPRVGMSVPVPAGVRGSGWWRWGSVGDGQHRRPRQRVDPRRYRVRMPCVPGGPPESSGC